MPMLLGRGEVSHIRRETEARGEGEHTEESKAAGWWQATSTSPSACSQLHIPG